MNQISPSRAQADHAQVNHAQRLVARVNYLKPDSTKPAVYLYQKPDGARSADDLIDPHMVMIADARPQAGTLSLDERGFALAAAPTRVTNFDDPAERAARYDCEVAALVTAATGAAKVLVFDHTIRRIGNANTSAETRAPVYVAHNDYTETSGPQRVRDLLSAADAQHALGRRFAIVNVWRSIAGTVTDTPLAFADARSTQPEDFIAVDLKYPDRTGEVYRLAHNPAHRWFYFPRLRADEALLIKSYDSATDGRARFTPHTAIDLPETAPGSAKRQSIESRALAFF
jgi:hypothetical protein